MDNTDKDLKVFSKYIKDTRAKSTIKKNRGKKVLKVSSNNGPTLKEAMRAWAKYKAQTVITPLDPPYNMVIDDESNGVVLHCWKCNCPPESNIQCAMLDKMVGSVRVMLQSAARPCCAGEGEKCLTADKCTEILAHLLDQVDDITAEETELNAKNYEYSHRQEDAMLEMVEFLLYLKNETADPEVDFVLNCFYEAFL